MKTKTQSQQDIPVILMITSFPPRECGIATYSQDLYDALKTKFNTSFELQICALESNDTRNDYPSEVRYILQTNIRDNYALVAEKINNNRRISLVLIQHEFGFFSQIDDSVFRSFLLSIIKPKILVFHTVLSNPAQLLYSNVGNIAKAVNAIIVMTKHAANTLQFEYLIPKEKITIISHGTHLVPHLDKNTLKAKHQLSGKKILSTFGLINPGKSIETTLDALPQIIEKEPTAYFLIIGKTHPGVVAHDEEKYRDFLTKKVSDLHLENHVLFINKYLSLSELLEFLQLTDIYLFTSNDPHQTVSGTFSYAMSCGCPIISTPIPHAKEVLNEANGILINFNHADQLADAAITLLEDEKMRQLFRLNAIERITSTSWENSAIAHAKLFQHWIASKEVLTYSLPGINLKHMSNLTTYFGMVQFSIINEPDLDSGYTLDDNARAMIALCMYLEETGDEKMIASLQIYLNFIGFCQQPNGNFLNYVDVNHEFTQQNEATNLSDSNGRAIWALGYLLSKQHLLPETMRTQAKNIFEKAILAVKNMDSPRSMAFVIKGLYYNNKVNPTSLSRSTIVLFATRLNELFASVSEPAWPWFENYFTYANSVLPEALLMAWEETGNLEFLSTAKTSFDFLLSITFTKDNIKVISNKTWLHKGHSAEEFGEQPIDIAYTILALNSFYEVYHEKTYLDKSSIAFSWFLGNNHLEQIIYNPCTGGCFDGLEEKNVNLNQGAESTISYLISRLTIERQVLATRRIQFDRLSYKKHEHHQIHTYSNQADSLPSTAFS